MYFIFISFQHLDMDGFNTDDDDDDDDDTAFCLIETSVIESEAQTGSYKQYKYCIAPEMHKTGVRSNGAFV